MRRRKISELSVGESARCGRCAQILPDETHSYCPACGALFSKVPPTTSFVLLSERAARRSMERFWAATFLWGVMLLGLGAFLSELQNQNFIRKLKAEREVVFYLKDVPQFPSLPMHVKREALAIALQSFEDHFGFALKNYRVVEGELPPVLGFLDELGWRGDFESINFWDRKVFKPLASEFYKDPQAPLPVLITNVPLSAAEDSSGIEVRHLDDEAIVSGLGHPALVLVSAHRILTKQKEFIKQGVSLETLSAQARYLGEYLVAHELGHALLGLSDYVVNSTAPTLRAPASELAATDERELASSKECLMHTDEGGGYKSWGNLYARPLGRSSRCGAYKNILRAYELRAEAIALLKQGKRAEAERLHLEAIDMASDSTQGWVKEVWKREHPLFQALFTRWITALFVFQWSDDQT